MGNTSATGGTLSPASPVPIDDDALDAVFQSLITAIVGLDGSLVRPRWQATVPTQPEPTVDWVAIGVTSEDPDDGPSIEYQPTTNDTKVKRGEEVMVVASIYGPHSGVNARRIRDGLSVPQNLEVLLQYAIRFVSCGPARNIPEFKNQTWLRRKDIQIKFRRRTETTYEIQNIVEADIHLFDDTGKVDREITVTEPST